LHHTSTYIFINLLLAGFLTERAVQPETVQVVSGLNYTCGIHGESWVLLLLFFRDWRPKTGNNPNRAHLAANIGTSRRSHAR